MAKRIPLENIHLFKDETTIPQRNSSPRKLHQHLKRKKPWAWYWAHSHKTKPPRYATVFQINFAQDSWLESKRRIRSGQSLMALGVEPTHTSNPTQWNAPPPPQTWIVSTPYTSYTPPVQHLLPELAARR